MEQQSLALHASVAVLAADGAVVRTLRLRITHLRESKRPRQVAIQGHQRVLLFDSEPRFFFEASVEDLLCEVAEVGAVWLGQFDVVLGLTEHEDVRSSSEWVGVHRDRLEEDLGVVSGGLFGAGAVVVPGFEVLDLADACAVVQHFGLTSQLLLPSQPDLLSKHRVFWCFVLSLFEVVVQHS